MFARMGRWWVHGQSPRRRPGRRFAPKFETGLEPLEGRALLSHLGANPVRLARAASSNIHNRLIPFHGNGVAIKLNPRFYPLYTGPKRPDLNAVQASAVVSGGDLILSGTVAGPIVTNPATASAGAVYAFLLNRGGANIIGPYPARANIRVDSVITVTTQPGGVSATLQLDEPASRLPGEITPLKSSDVTINGDTVTVRVPTDGVPSSGKAFNQWLVNFSPRMPVSVQTARTVASFLPEFSDFQVYVQPTLPKA
jgi:hypothetical protein